MRHLFTRHRAKPVHAEIQIYRSERAHRFRFTTIDKPLHFGRDYNF